MNQAPMWVAGALFYIVAPVFFAWLWLRAYWEPQGFKDKVN